VPGLANEVCAKTLGLGRSLRITHTPLKFYSAVWPPTIKGTPLARPIVLSTGDRTLSPTHTHTHIYTRTHVRHRLLYPRGSSMGGHHGRSLFHDVHPGSRPRSPSLSVAPIITYLSRNPLELTHVQVCELRSCVVALL